ncbi:DMT family transporter [Niallia taxi]|nr:DMT family transporter [Niallia taxi]MDE5054174.1 DMT family transporter [Niallia taxi]
MLGILLAIMAGGLVGVQNIFNNKVMEKAGSLTTTTLVLGMGFLASFITGLVVEGGRLFVFTNMEPWYLVSGFIGVGVVYCITSGVKLLGPTYAIAIVMFAQLGFALVSDTFGWFGTDPIPFTLKQKIGVFIIIGGILMFKLGNLKGRETSSVLKKAS